VKGKETEGDEAYERVKRKLVRLLVGKGKEDGKKSQGPT